MEPSAAQSVPELRSLFSDPPDFFRPVPFWWWSGEPLDRDRLRWQLDALLRGGVKGAIVGYSHFPDGRTDPGDPPVFSEAWWGLFRWALEECGRRGMYLGFQDYTLINPLLAEIGRANPHLRGGDLGERHQLLREGGEADLVCPDGCEPLVAAAYAVSRDRKPAGPGRSLLDRMSAGRLRWRAPPGRWLVSLVWLRPAPFDPLHPEAGPRVIERLYAPFERQCPGALGRTLRVFFQDELDFGRRMPMWSDRLPSRFAAEKGYDPTEHLPALWHDVGPFSPKFRIDFADVVVRLLEASYFAPIHRWHEDRGTLFGHDNAGRGAIGTGRRYYGDYFRTMRWYSAPGTDDPQLARPRAFRGLKVSASIAQLYGRRRVWVEAFHSSGWGAPPAAIVAGLNEDLQLGATCVNLHGLYYTTFGSWWEWAAPDFHFRQPYWQHARPMNDALARLCSVLSQGAHACDTAILYPIAALEGGLNREHSTEGGPEPSLSEAQRGETEPGPDAAEAAAFQVGRGLVEAGEDFDFIDFESVERATCRDGILAVAGAAYRTLVLPEMSTIRFATLLKAREFMRAGGRVLAVGAVPIASDRAGAGDPLVAQLALELFGGPQAVAADAGAAVRLLVGVGDADFAPEGAPLQALHRKLVGTEVYFVRNPLDRPVRASAVFRARGRPERWDAWTGTMSLAQAEDAGGGRTRIGFDLAAAEAQLVVFDAAAPPATVPASAEAPPATVQVLPSQGWEFELAPTMDNRYGDFRRPPSTAPIGAEARRFRFREERPGDDIGKLAGPGLDDGAWPAVLAGYGPRLWKLGPLPPEAADEAWAARFAQLVRVDPDAPVFFGKLACRWEPYAFSLEWGIERDPFLLDWQSGPHGLKGHVPDEFIDLACDRPGAVWYLWTSLQSDAARDAVLVAGSRAAFSVWLNGQGVIGRAEAMPAGVHPAWNLRHYDSPPLRAPVQVRAGDNPLLIRAVQPADQRFRAYVALDAPPATDRPALRWFAHRPSWRFNPRPDERTHAGWYRFTAPPGLERIELAAKGELSAWSNGEPMAVERIGPGAHGASAFAARAAYVRDEPTAVAVRIAQAPDSFGGDSVAAPVRLFCRPGRASLGDWSRQGLEAYSGAAWYRRHLDLDPAAARSGRWYVDLGAVAVSAEVWWNGEFAGVRLCPPWRVEVTRWARPGGNRLEVKVANTLANHYGAGIPTPYFLPEQTVSGLLGPVKLLRARPGDRMVS